MMHAVHDDVSRPAAADRLGQLLRLTRAAALSGLILVNGCGDLPQPFRGNAGGMTPQLVAPPGARVAVPRSPSILPDAAMADRVAEALAEALRVAEVPAVAAEPLPLDWRVAVTTERRGPSMILRYALLDPDGAEQGSAEAAPVPLSVWTGGGELPLRDISRAAARRIGEMMLRAEAARKASEPAALVAGGPPRIRVVPVGGAPGDGNMALTMRLTGFLTQAGFLVSDSASSASFAVQGLVTVANTQPGTQRVEILWTVSRRDGEELGRVLQLNEIPRGALDVHWGDVAYAAAQEAAGGVRSVVGNAGGFPRSESSTAQAAAARGSASPRVLVIPPVTAALPVPQGNVALASLARPVPEASAQASGSGTVPASVTAAVAVASAAPVTARAASAPTAPAAPVFEMAQPVIEVAEAPEPDGPRLDLAAMPEPIRPAPRSTAVTVAELRPSGGGFTLLAPAVPSFDDPFPGTQPAVVAETRVAQAPSRLLTVPRAALDRSPEAPPQVLAALPTRPLAEAPTGLAPVPTLASVSAAPRPAPTTVPAAPATTAMLAAVVPPAPSFDEPVMMAEAATSRVEERPVATAPTPRRAGRGSDVAAVAASVPVPVAAPPALTESVAFTTNVPPAPSFDSPVMVAEAATPRVEERSVATAPAPRRAGRSADLAAVAPEVRSVAGPVPNPSPTIMPAGSAAFAAIVPPAPSFDEPVMVAEATIPRVEERPVAAAPAPRRAGRSVDLAAAAPEIRPATAPMASPAPTIMPAGNAAFAAMVPPAPSFDEPVMLAEAAMPRVEERPVAAAPAPRRAGRSVDMAAVAPEVRATTAPMASPAPTIMPAGNAAFAAIVPPAPSFDEPVMLAEAAMPRVEERPAAAAPAPRRAGRSVDMAAAVPEARAATAPMASPAPAITPAGSAAFAAIVPPAPSFDEPVMVAEAAMPRVEEPPVAAAPAPRRAGRSVDLAAAVPEARPATVPMARQASPEAPGGRAGYAAMVPPAPRFDQPLVVAEAAAPRVVDRPVAAAPNSRRIGPANDGVVAAPAMATAPLEAPRAAPGAMAGSALAAVVPVAPRFDEPVVAARAAEPAAEARGAEPRPSAEAPARLAAAAPRRARSGDMPSGSVAPLLMAEVPPAPRFDEPLAPIQVAEAAPVATPPVAAVPRPTISLAEIADRPRSVRTSETRAATTATMAEVPAAPRFDGPISTARVEAVPSSPERATQAPRLNEAPAPMAGPEATAFASVAPTSPTGVAAEAAAAPALVDAIEPVRPAPASMAALVQVPVAPNFDGPAMTAQAAPAVETLFAGLETTPTPRRREMRSVEGSRAPLIAPVEVVATTRPEAPASATLAPTEVAQLALPRNTAATVVAPSVPVAVAALPAEVVPVPAPVVSPNTEVAGASGALAVASATPSVTAVAAPRVTGLRAGQWASAPAAARNAAPAMAEAPPAPAREAPAAAIPTTSPPVVTTAVVSAPTPTVVAALAEEVLPGTAIASRAAISPERLSRQAEAEAPGRPSQAAAATQPQTVASRRDGEASGRRTQTAAAQPEAATRRTDGEAAGRRTQTAAAQPEAAARRTDSEAAGRRTQIVAAQPEAAPSRRDGEAAGRRTQTAAAQPEAAPSRRDGEAAGRRTQTAAAQPEAATRRARPEEPGQRQQVARAGQSETVTRRTEAEAAGRRAEARGASSAEAATRVAGRTETAPRGEGTSRLAALSETAARRSAARVEDPAPQRAARNERADDGMVSPSVMLAIRNAVLAEQEAATRGSSVRSSSATRMEEPGTRRRAVPAARDSAVSVAAPPSSPSRSTEVMSLGPRADAGSNTRRRSGGA